MKPFRSFLALFAAAVLAQTPSANAAIALDFGATGQDVQAGFFAVSASAMGNVAMPFEVPAAALPDGEMVSISSSSVLNFRDRTSGNATHPSYAPYGDLFEDYIRAGNGSAVSGGNPFSTMIINITQLEPLAEYRLTLRIYDGAITATSVGTYSFEITGTGDLHPVENTFMVGFDSSGAPFSGITIEERDGYTETFQSDLFGNLQLTVTQLSGTENTVPVNSLELVLVPEPASAALGLAAGAMLVARRRRRHR